MIAMVRCPHCRTVVLPRTDRTCPACQNGVDVPPTIARLRARGNEPPRAAGFGVVVKGVVEAFLILASFLSSPLRSTVWFVIQQRSARSALRSRRRPRAGEEGREDRRQDRGSRRGSLS